MIEKSSFEYYFRESVMLEIRYNIIVKGALELYCLKWAFTDAKQGGTAEVNLSSLMGWKVFLYLKIK